MFPDRGGVGPVGGTVRWGGDALWWHVGGDVVFFSSLFVLGGDFWDKLRALFVHGARAVFPAISGGNGGAHE